MFSQFYTWILYWSGKELSFHFLEAGENVSQPFPLLLDESLSYTQSALLVDENLLAAFCLLDLCLFASWIQSINTWRSALTLQHDILKGKSEIGRWSIWARGKRVRKLFPLVHILFYSLLQVLHQVFSSLEALLVIGSRFSPPPPS